MRKLGIQKIVAIALFVVGIASIGIGLYGTSQRGSELGGSLLDTMRLQALLSTSSEGVVEAMVTAAKKEATAKVRAEGGGMDVIKEATAKAEEEVRSSITNIEIDFSTIDSVALDAAVDVLVAAQKDYAEQEALDREAYRQMMLAQTAAEEEEVDADALSADESGEAMDDMALEEEPVVDMSGFAITPEMEVLQAVVDAEFVLLSGELKNVFPDLDDSSILALKGTITSLLYQHGDSYETQYDRYMQNMGTALEGDEMQRNILRYGDDMVAVGIMFLFFGALVLFYQTLNKALGLPRLIIGSFFVILCLLALMYNLSLPTLLSNTIVRMGMNSILVLAMVPGIQCGISLNLGLPLGIIGGLVGGLLCIELGYSGWGGFAFALAVGILIAAVVGYFYSKLLNRLKGSEMAVTTYVGYSVVSLMCIGWLILPFDSPKLRWPLGEGLRLTLTIKDSYRHILNDLFAFKIGSISIPTGLLLFMALCCLIVWLFSRSRTGIAMQAVGNNPRFAEATGISVNKMRTIGTMFSTVLGAVGIIVYSQSYGFMQLYNAPRQMGFIAASAILIGGASTSRARISHVLIGTFLFQGVLTLGMPVANVLVPQSTISETLRILISNGIILYALTKSGGGSRA